MAGLTKSLESPIFVEFDRFRQELNKKKTGLKMHPIFIHRGFHEH
jgi:hypothetical protein